MNIIGSVVAFVGLMDAKLLQYGWVDTGKQGTESCQPSRKESKMNDTVECKRCGSICQIDGEFPKFFAYCDNCQNYVDVDDYTADYLASEIDRAYEKSKYEHS